MKASAIADMRAFHRWFGIVGAVFMIFIALTGLALQIDLVVTGNPVPGSEHAAAPRPGPLPADAEIGRLAAASIAAARRARPAMVVEHLDLAFTPGGVRAVAGAASPFGDHLTLDARTGAVLPEWRLTPGWHNWLQNLHAGYSFGPVGRVLSAIMAVSLLALGVTGLIVYFDLYRRRRRGGRVNPLWK